MAEIKIYEMPGCISCRLKFSLGKAQPFEAYFDGGIPDKNYPAVYGARTIGQQLAIENSDMFKSGKIRLRKKRSAGIRATMDSKPQSVPGDGVSVTDEISEEAASVYSPKAYPEVTTLVDAISILKGEYGVSATRLKSEAGVFRVAEEKGVSFPNLKV